MKSKALTVYNELINAACIVALVALIVGIAFIIVSPGW